MDSPLDSQLQRFEEGERARVSADTAFILGNGPSLAQTDLTSLSNFATIGLNAAYRHWRQIDWRPRYYACLDLVVGMSHKDAIAELIEEGRIERFLLRANLIEALGATGRNSRVINFDIERTQAPLLAIDPITSGSHSALWAASMGYAQIVLLGVDVNYTEVVDGAARRDGIELEIVRSGANPNYYFDGYQAPGDKFNLPNPRPDLHVNAWKRAAQALGVARVRIYNANRASGVKCFPFISLERFMHKGDVPSPATESAQISLDAGAQPLSGKQRRQAFIKAYKTKSAAAAILMITLWFAFVLMFGLSPLASIATFAGGAIIFVAAMAALYTRFAILTHLHRTDEELKALRAQLAFVEDQMSRTRN